MAKRIPQVPHARPVEGLLVTLSNLLAPRYEQEQISPPNWDITHIDEDVAMNQSDDSESSDEDSNEENHEENHKCEPTNGRTIRSS